MIKKFIQNRLRERTTLDGLVLIGAGVCFLIFKPIASIVAYGAMIYGAYTLLKKD
jgi:multisubunit Na+/H+ antiporter MnhB subunit